MYFFLSVPMENFKEIMIHIQSLKEHGIKASINRPSVSIPNELFQRSGGIVVLVDWKNQKILGGKKFPAPMAVLLDGDRLMLGLWQKQAIAVLEGGKQVKTISHRWFNHVHTIDPTPWGTYLITSSGCDLIAELTLEGEITWTWWAFEHGYDKLPTGEPRIFNKEEDYRSVELATDNRSTHVNSALLIDDNTLLATLFHQGQLVKIRRDTGDVEVLFEGLDHPHCIRRRRAGFLLSDTRHGRIVLFDKSLQFEREISYGASWIQDSFEASDGSLFSIADCDIFGDDPGETNSVVQLDPETSKILRRLNAGDQPRLYQFKEVTQEQAFHWQHLWKDEPFDLSSWTWE
ncbi:MAG: hypothetical protein HYY20_02845 [Candidatus Tectomicrobia bacterium]|uniref:Uncharacterized protein n=1 Tax=Tectimicrobiota bacterium TaxID=2528274 RepID=A0A932CLX4_UNCTE|nr:hypothetical protein [Candidatus Tectomicrobia bacterium]